MNTFISHVRISLTAMVVFIAVLCVAYPLLVWGIAQGLFPGKANGSLITRPDGTVIGSQLIGQNFSDPKWFHPRPSEAGNGYDPTSSGGSNLGPTSAKLINGTTKTPSPQPAPADAAAPVASAASVPALTAAPTTAAAATSTPASGASSPSAPTPAASASAAAASALVVDFDGIKLRVLHYCDDNGIAFDLLRDGKTVDQATFKTKDGWDEVKLIIAFNDDHPVTVQASRSIPVDAVTASASGLDPHISVSNALLQAPRVAKARGMDEGLVRTLITQNTDGPDLGILGEAGVNVLRLNLALDIHH